MSEKKLGEYLLQLVTDPKLLRKFLAQPAATAALSDLNDTKIEALLHGNLRRILAELEEEYGHKPGDHFYPT